MPLSPPLPPPLPSSLSSRLLSTINPHTGTCKHHPTIQLCELAQNNSRWVVRRKICPKCGARAPMEGGRHMPGVSVSRIGNPPPPPFARSHSAPPRVRHQSAKPLRRRQNCVERQHQSDATPNLVTESFKSRTISTTSLSLSRSRSGSRSGSALTGSNASTEFETKDVGKLKKSFNKNKTTDKANTSSHNGSDSSKEHRRGRNKDIHPSTDMDISPRKVSFDIPKTELPFIISPPPFHREIMPNSRRRKQNSSMNPVENDIIKNVGCIYFYPTA